MHERPIARSRRRAARARRRYPLPRQARLSAARDRRRAARAPACRSRIRGDVSSQFLTGAADGAAARCGRERDRSTVDVTTPLISRPYVDDHDSTSCSASASTSTRAGCVDVRRAGRRALREPRHAARRGRRVGGVLFPRGRRARRRAGSRARRGPRLDPGRRRVRRRARAAGRRRRASATDWIEARSGGRLPGGTIDCTPIPDAAMTLAVIALFARRTRPRSPASRAGG